MTPAEFVRAGTRLAAPPLVPELRLRLADDALALWERLQEEYGPQQPLPYWAFAWAGGQALARHVLDNPASVAGRRVLDLASGSGIVAIAAAKGGAGFVAPSEIDPLAATAGALNADANRTSVGEALGDVLDGDGEDADVVLAGDIFYERATAARVLPFLERAAKRGASVMVGDPSRDHFPRHFFEPLATYDVPVTRALEDGERKATTVWRLAGSGEDRERTRFDRA